MMSWMMHKMEVSLSLFSLLNQVPFQVLSKYIIILEVINKKFNSV